MKQPAEPVISADFAAFVRNWYQLTGPGGPYHQKQQDPKR